MLHNNRRRESRTPPQNIGGPRDDEATAEALALANTRKRGGRRGPHNVKGVPLGRIKQQGLRREE